MRGFRLLMLGILVLVVGAVAGLWVLAPSGPQKIALPGGGEMHVLKVSLGTNHILSFEPRWKQLARRLMPSASQSAWGAFTGERTQNKYEALVLWLDGSRMSDSKGFSIDKAEAVFTNAFAPGTVNAKPGMVRLTFQCFARDQKLVPLRVWQGSNMVEFQVANPRPVKEAASWTALPVPQTQAVSRAEVVLKGLRPVERRRSGLEEYMPLLYVKAAKPSWPGFVAWWHVTAFDRWGNYSEAKSGYDPYKAPSFTPFPRDRGPWRILVDGEEYLNAGYFPEPTNQLAVVVSPTPRMQDLGIRFLMMVGPGVYTVTNGTLGSVANAPLKTDPWEWSMEGSDGTGKTNRLTTWVPGIFCLSDVIPGMPAPRMRTHERDARNEGVTRPATGLCWTNISDGMKQRVQVFRPRFPKVFTNACQVEVISDLAAEFFVEPPAEQMTKPD